MVSEPSSNAPQEARSRVQRDHGRSTQQPATRAPGRSRPANAGRTPRGRGRTRPRRGGSARRRHRHRAGRPARTRPGRRSRTSRQHRDRPGPGHRPPRRRRLARRVVPLARTGRGGDRDRRLRRLQPGRGRAALPLRSGPSPERPGSDDRRLPDRAHLGACAPRPALAVGAAGHDHPVSRSPAERRARQQPR